MESWTRCWRKWRRFLSEWRSGAGAHIKDHRSADRLVRRTTELQAHAATDEAGFEHGPAPGGPVDRDRNRLGAEHRVPGNQGLTRPLVEDGVRAIPGGYFENRARPHVAQVNSSLDFG